MVKTAKTNRDEIRQNTLSVPMSRQEKMIVQKAADDMGVPMSAFVRIVIKDFMKKANN